MKTPCSKAWPDILYEEEILNYGPACWTLKTNTEDSLLTR